MQSLVHRFTSTTDVGDDGLDKETFFTPVTKKKRTSGQENTESVAEDLRKLEAKDTSQMSELFMRRHTAAITRLQVGLDSRKLKLST